MPLKAQTINLNLFCYTVSTSPLALLVTITVLKTEQCFSGGGKNNTNLEKKRKGNLCSVSIILQHGPDLMQQCFRLLLLLRVWLSPFLVLVQTTSKISEQPIDTDLIEPIFVFDIRVLMEVEVQV